MILPGTTIELDIADWIYGPWWKREAFHAIGTGHFEAITGRHDAGLYLLRCWLSTPVRGHDGKWDSADSLLVHYFARPDDDGSMHDHPWSFSREVLSGEYVEAVPRQEWTAADGGPDFGTWSPAYLGACKFYGSEDLHAVTSVQPDTWTLIRTGPRVRNWGFFPPGKPWVPWEEFLATKPAPT